MNVRDGGDEVLAWCWIAAYCICNGQFTICSSWWI